jgi:acyl carrier protein
VTTTTKPTDTFYLSEIAMNHNGSVSLISADSVKSWLCDWLAEARSMSSAEIDPGQTFLSYGLDSVQAMSMVGDLEAKLHRRLAPTLAWDYPTIDALAEHLAAQPVVEARARPVPVRTEARPDMSRQEIEHLLAGIEDLDEQEVDRLLAKYLGDS